MSKRKLISVLFLWLCYISAAVTVLLILGLVFTVFIRGREMLTVEILTGIPSFLKGTIGILPNILNTVYIVVLTLGIALPLGVGTAIYLNEYRRAGITVRIIEFAVDILAGVPSIIYGLVGLLVFVTSLGLGTSIISGALTMAFVVLPGIVRTSLEALKSVPAGYRDGAFALGTGRWHTTRTVVLPSALNGVLAGAILSVGRIIGESAALIFTAGVADKMLNIFEIFSPNNSGSTLTVALYIYAKERGDFDMAFTIALVLVLLSFVLNLSARALFKIGRVKT
ncbi:MAG: phosphate ABC transporter permease PstA [Ruminococcaceae bacterium]|nr:phosphate ABC transporter permease PstA [Oscillospiraceae bacterium]